MTYEQARNLAREMGRDGETEPETYVVFRFWRESKDVIALFPCEKADDRGHIMSFEHVGQHGGADYTGIIANSRPATEAEYAALKRELESAPYNYRLRVMQRRPNWRGARG